MKSSRVSAVNLAGLCSCRGILSGHHGSHPASSLLHIYFAGYHERSPGASCLLLCKISAGLASITDALPEFVRWIALRTSSMIVEWASSAWIRRCGVWFSAFVVTDEGLLSRLLKYYCHRSLSPSWSLIRVLPSDDSSGEQPKCRGVKD